MEPAREGNLFSETIWNKVKEGRYDPWIESAITGQVRDEGAYISAQLALSDEQHRHLL